MDSTQVLIVGGGPVGMGLALDLGRRGIACILVEKRREPMFLPKMEQCRPRTMEIYRRLGIADRVRRAGYPAELPMDAYIVASLADREPVVRWTAPSVQEQFAAFRGRDDGAHPVEPYQLISQYTLEPLLKEAIEEIACVDVRFGVELVSLDASDDGVVAMLESPEGEAKVGASYLVGCDGGSSTVRRELDIRLRGEPDLGQLRQALFRCDGLYERIPVGQGRHYHVADDRSTFLIVQDDCRHFSLHADVPSDDDMVELFRSIVRSVDPRLMFETLYVGEWTMRLMVAESYGAGRVFLAGDAAHLTTPTLGLGMNTGVGDATDLAWKLAGTLEGWGGTALLESYERERRPVALRNVEASGRALQARRAWRAAYRPNVREASPDGSVTRQRIAELSQGEKAVRAETFDDYVYAESPIVASGSRGSACDGERPAEDCHLGRRLPSVWMDDGSPLQDRLGLGYSLLRLGAAPADGRPLVGALERRGAPVEVVDVSSLGARRICGADLVLVRPDLHVAWQGSAPADVEQVADVVTGHGRAR
ncbi:FAD-dependent monooxygenase [Nocardioides cheoyonin]|uniref:FAD-dependent monooxygenase n=1 Tax=Nocardioides cheoyonin TaxID=3156615 RepID=UPI0032B5FEA4